MCVGAMTSIFYVGVSRTRPLGRLTRLCKTSNNHNVAQVAFMTRLALKDELAKPAPFPYWKKHCTPVGMWCDYTSLRYDENTKIIVVDGPPAVGKAKFCQKIAEAFGLLYMPPPVHDDLYINSYGYDIRELDSQLPDSCHSYDLQNFLADPHHLQVPHCQLAYFSMRLEQYLNALLHALATGQGVILNRSVLSDIAFVHAMYKSGYLTKEEVKNFEDMRTAGMGYILKPHIAIYLDAPPDITLQKIKRRGIPAEVNSKVLTEQYLADLEAATKEKYLSPLAPHSEILVYDWIDEGNYDDIIHDIECLDLQGENEKLKFHDWVFLTTEDIIEHMIKFQDKVDIVENTIYAGDPDTSKVPRLWVPVADVRQLTEIYDSTNEVKYSPGFNPHFGDKVFFARPKKMHMHIVRRSPRDFVNADFMKSG